MVERLERHAAGEGAVADHGNRVAMILRLAGGDRHPQSGADGGARVAGAESVIWRLDAAGEPGEAILEAQAAHHLAPASENLVRIGLVADVPDDAVFRGIEHLVQGDREFDHAEAGGEMAAGTGDALHQEVT